VKKVLSAAPSTITFQDDNGNAALHVAAYNGHWGVVKEILRRVPPLFLTINNDGNTVLHLAVGGFKASGFRSPDRHMEVIKNLVSDKTLNLQTMVNCKNRDGKTPLHIAVILGKRSDEKLLNLLVSVPGLDINICDKNGMTAYDMVKATVASGLTPESLLKCLAEAGGRPMIPQSPTASQLLKRAAEQTEIIRLWAHKEDDEICTERCEIIEEFSDKISEFANSKNMAGNQMNNYLAKHRRGTLPLSLRRRLRPSKWPKLWSVLLIWVASLPKTSVTHRAFMHPNFLNQLSVWISWPLWQSKLGTILSTRTHNSTRLPNVQPGVSCMHMDRLRMKQHTLI